MKKKWVIISVLSFVLILFISIFMIDYLNPRPSEETRTVEYFHYSLEIIPEIKSEEYTVILPILINGEVWGTSDFIPDEHYSPDDFIAQITSDEFLPGSEVIKTEKGWGLTITNSGNLSINITQDEYIEYTNFNMQNKSWGPSGDFGNYFYWVNSDADFTINISIVCNAYWERIGTAEDFFKGANIDNTNIDGDLKNGWNLIAGEENDSNIQQDLLD